MAVPCLDHEALQVYRQWLEAQASPSPLSMKCFSELVAEVQKPPRQELEGQKKELERQKKELERQKNELQKQKKEVEKLLQKMKVALGARAPRTPPLRGPAGMNRSAAPDDGYDRPTPHGEPSVFDEPAHGLDEESQIEWSVEYEDPTGEDDDLIPETSTLRATPKKRSCPWK